MFSVCSPSVSLCWCVCLREKDWGRQKRVSIIQDCWERLELERIGLTADELAARIGRSKTAMGRRGFLHAPFSPIWHTGCTKKYVFFALIDCIKLAWSSPLATNYRCAHSNQLSTAAFRRRRKGRMLIFFIET